VVVLSSSWSVFKKIALGDRDINDWFHSRCNLMLLTAGVDTICAINIPIVQGGMFYTVMEVKFLCTSQNRVIMLIAN
jgi:hypothetical protein